jgi:hypothetical protein
VRARFVYAHIFPRRTQAQTGARRRAACARGARAAKSAQRAAAGASGGGNHCSNFFARIFSAKKKRFFFSCKHSGQKIRKQKWMLLRMLDNCVLYMRKLLTCSQRNKRTRSANASITASTLVFVENLLLE